ncbi:anthranilate phosphoribosyltransferase [Serpentinicella alkaliphila]|uniref:Anthranilate phosphoribosyltransferase n=1 Tax=Serpentinicella alkaliphila TaxID=1734049 RepID=A0A4R2TJB0_9FIRM|nr:anthranilate phosphoribosyltransferase [Serpentinicella alkaliphila]QUH25303.1 anthranilate phosphoribosyltransferase [Serpentinicella alkaliphila]TCQ02412.1 anthranilate phosphoribosyltransferase [Serpentinicella alkaliphila]
MIKDSINKLVHGISLSEYEMTEALNEIMSGLVSPTLISSFLTALKLKGETIEEITGGAKVLRKKCSSIDLNDLYTIDTCGTGGDNSNTFNISTAVAFIAASAGIPVVKHGNRSVTSKSGSADVLEALGANIYLSPTQVEHCILNHNLGFLFAPNFHSAMKHVAETRKELGFRTIFNILGPLSNPASAKAQVLGVFEESLTEPLAHVLKNLGTKHALVVHGMDGIDEITVTTDTKITELRENKIFTYYLNPKDYGFTLCKHEDLNGGDARENGKIIKSIFLGEQGPKRDILLLNSAAALYIGRKVDNFRDGITLASNLLDSGAAYRKLTDYVEETRLLL